MILLFAYDELYVLAFTSSKYLLLDIRFCAMYSLELYPSFNIFFPLSLLNFQILILFGSETRLLQHQIPDLLLHE